MGICFVYPPTGSFNSFFGFAEFITALTLIAVVFTISDVRYRFRISVAPLPLITISFWSAVGIGVLVLSSDIWFSQRWILPRFLSSQALWQGVLAFLFLIVVLTWIYFAFLRPARFTRFTAKRYTIELYRMIVRGDDAELPTIANELARSVRGIVDLCPTSVSNASNNPSRRALAKYRGYAHDLLLLIGNRKFCRHIVARAPGTAIQLFQRISETQKYHVPIRQFAINLSTEAIQNTDSILYHEGEGYDLGLLGYIRPFSAAVYGDYRLVEGLGQGFGSPLDINYKSVDAWNAE